VAKKLKHKDFKFTLSHLLRLTVFSTIVYLLINYLSTARFRPNILDPTVLGEIDQNPPVLRDLLQQAYDRLPAKYRDKIDLINFFGQNSPAASTAGEVQKQLKGFPGEQIKQLQKYLLDRLYQDMIKKINLAN